nr:GGDEF domain-containing protein [Aeromonas caviae]
MSCHGLPIYSAIPIGRFGNGRLNSAQSGRIYPDVDGPRGLQPGIHHPLHHLVDPQGNTRSRALVVVQPLCPGGAIALLHAGICPPYRGDLAGQPAHHLLPRPDATRHPALLRGAAKLAGLHPLHAGLPADPLLERHLQRQDGPPGAAGLPELHDGGGGDCLAHLAARLSRPPAGRAGVHRGQHPALRLQPGAHGLPAQRRGAGADGSARGQRAALPLHADGQLSLHLRGVAALHPVPGAGPAPAGEPGSPDRPPEPARLHGSLRDDGKAGGAGGAGSRRLQQINDRHGHETGDRVLEAVGRYLAGQRDLVASRFGGEEFVLLLPERDPLAQQARCEQIRQGIETLGLKGVRVTASLGWAPSAREWHFDTLFSQADRALYQAKREGKNRICQGA